MKLEQVKAVVLGHAVGDALGVPVQFAPREERDEKLVTECGLRGERSNGNGSLMRIHPAALFLADSDFPVEEKIKLIHSVSALTHAHVRAMIGCGIYTLSAS